DAEVGEAGDPAEVGAHDVRQLVGRRARGELLEQVVVGDVDVLDGDAGVLGLEGGDELVVEDVLLGGVPAVAVGAPEGQGDVLGRGTVLVGGGRGVATGGAGRDGEHGRHRR